MDTTKSKIRAGLLALGRGAVLVAGSLSIGVLLVCLLLVSLASIPLGIGLVTTSALLTGARPYAEKRREAVAARDGVQVAAVYREVPAGGTGWVRTSTLLRDPQAWRDLVRLPVDMTAGLLTGHTSMSAKTDSSNAVDPSATELHRIERDLHDGAQARLTAMGTDLGTIEKLVEDDPAKAKELLAQARRNSAEALEELQDLVLAEHGLGDAVRALALRLPLPAEVSVELPGRAQAPVESAAYFAVSELLTNVVKHAEAERVWVDLHYAEGRLRVSVTDDGRGGAAAGDGSGLAGVERRLGVFDGVLALSSPVGGPTLASLEIPCGLS